MRSLRCIVERELALWSDWSGSAIEERRAKLLKWAITRWAIDTSHIEGRELEPEDIIEFDEDTYVVADTYAETED